MMRSAALVACCCVAARAFSSAARGAAPVRRCTTTDDVDLTAEAAASLAALEREHWDSLSAVERKILARSRAGDAYLKLGQFRDALDAFDEAQALSGGERYEWRRGVALFYLGEAAAAAADFDANAARFEARFEEPATEERLWGAAASRLAGAAPRPPPAADLPRESRPVLRAATALFAGDGAAALDALRGLCSTDDDKLRRRLHGHFFAGLYYDAEGDAAAAAAHLALAAARAREGPAEDDLTAALPGLHAAARGWALADVEEKDLAAAATFAFPTAPAPSPPSGAGAGPGRAAPLSRMRKPALVAECAARGLPTDGLKVADLRDVLRNARAIK